MDVRASQEVVEHILEHHGVRGMKWGVRRDRSSGSGGESSSTKTRKVNTPREVTVKTTQNRQIKTQVRTKGGEAHPAHPDAVAARVAAQKYKKSGPNALSNQELQQLSQRLNLEAQVNRLTPKSGVQRGMHFVQTYLKSPAGQSASKDITEMASKSIAKKLATKAAAAGVAAAL
jgi:hypothetical protein